MNRCAALLRATATVAARRCAISAAGKRFLSGPAAQLRVGQPLYETHPHLLKAGEVTPGITAREYFERRLKLAKELPPNSIAVLAANELKYASGAVFYKFHQDPDFRYLTGFLEQDALAIIEKVDEQDHVFHLYVRPKDAWTEAWEGSRCGIEAAEHVFNADITGSFDDLPSLLPEIVNRSTAVYTDLPQNRINKNPVSRYLAGADPSSTGGIATVFRNSGASIRPLRPLLNELRVIKSQAEIANMRRAGQHSGRAITDAMRQSFSHEKDIDSFLDYWFKQDQCDGPAYVPVVAGGTNANTIHYVRNDMALDPNALVLVDAGASYGGYVTDITRTWPVSGKFTASQKRLYTLLLTVQTQCIALCHASSNTSLDKLHSIACHELASGLKDLGFNLDSKNDIATLFPHHLGHYLGLDVHDSPGLDRSRPLKTGMAVTVEPGIYVPHDDRWPEWARGIAIRIEDSVVVDEQSPYVLTTEAPKQIVDIEALRG